jgi:hypothetical protein
MSSDFPPTGDNPYSAPPVQAYAHPSAISQAPLKEDVVGQPWTMDYTGGFGMIHRMPDWLINTLLPGVCGLIPLIGGIVISGYAYEAVEVLHRTSGAYCPKFDFNRFVDYLVRGLGPFLVQLALGVVQAAIMFVCYIAFIVLAIGVGAAGEAGQGREATMGVGILLVFVGLIAFAFVMSLASLFVQIPLSLRGGLSGEIGQAFQFQWALDFIKKTWVEMLLVFLFLSILAVPLIVIAIITCYLGLIPGIGYMILVQAWLLFQLYRLYLSRGGQPVPLKPLPQPM